MRGEKPQTKGTPLTYKTPFVLGTSDGNGYSLNNKVPGQKDGVTLQPTAVKGEMYVSFEKDGFTSETVRCSFCERMVWSDLVAHFRLPSLDRM